MDVPINLPELTTSLAEASLKQPTSLQERPARELCAYCGQLMLPDGPARLAHSLTCALKEAEKMREAAERIYHANKATEPDTGPSRTFFDMACVAVDKATAALNQVLPRSSGSGAGAGTGRGASAAGKKGSLCVIDGDMGEESVEDQSRSFDSTSMSGSEGTPLCPAPPSLPPPPSESPSASYPPAHRARTPAPLPTAAPRACTSYVAGTTLTMLFKVSESDYEPVSITPRSRLFIGREKVRDFILKSFPNSKFYSPRERSNQSLLSSRQAHAVIEYLPATDPRVSVDGFYLRIVPKRNGDAPTNPLWRLEREAGKKAWTKLPFSPEPILLSEKQRFCIGAQFHFKVGSITVLSPATAEALAGGDYPLGDPPSAIITSEQDGSTLPSPSVPDMSKTDDTPPSIET